MWRNTGWVLLIILGALLLSALIPLRNSGEPAAAVAGEQYWQLSTGSTLRYVRIAAQGTPRPAPVIFVHGGPGTPDMKGDSEYFGQLAAAGFDVYVYDAVGSRRSTRLALPESYTLARDITELEEIRHDIGAARLLLIGHSYGARVVAGYTATHPQNVARAVFSSPESLDPTDRSGGNLTSRLDRSQLAALYSRLLRPRNLLVWSLLQINPDAAHSLARDAEMDAQNDLVYAITEPALHCTGQASQQLPTGLGFYRLQYPQSWSAPEEPDLRPGLTGAAVPALIIKGACDYLSWASAVTYLAAFENAELVYLHGGHNAYQDAPEQYLAVVRDFLMGVPLDVQATRDPSTPDDYEGPAD